jgi:pyrroline-5-carboxylate reductase
MLNWIPAFAGMTSEKDDFSIYKILLHYEQIYWYYRRWEYGWSNIQCSCKLKILSTEANDILQKADVIILAIKPQSFDEFAANIKINLSAKLIISIMAGVNIDRLSKGLKCNNIVRTMPNLPAQVGVGLTGFCCVKNVLKEDKKLIEQILMTFGEAVEVESEEKINEITALSGSGPAYFFHLAKLLEEKAREFGFGEKSARKIANATFIGSARILENGEMSAEEWEKAVCSPGGTTEAALKSMSENKFDETFKGGIDAAKKRAGEL